MELPYTICFCCCEQRVLMLHRAFPPNAQLWNGLGGSIESGETPLRSVQREMQEEAGISCLPCWKGRSLMSIFVNIMMRNSLQNLSDD